VKNSVCITARWKNIMRFHLTPSMCVLLFYAFFAVPPKDFPLNVIKIDIQQRNVNRTGKKFCRSYSSCRNIMWNHFSFFLFSRNLWQIVIVVLRDFQINRGFYSHSCHASMGWKVFERWKRDMTKYFLTLISADFILLLHYKWITGVNLYFSPPYRKYDDVCWCILNI
jgi:hypothetical protein